MSVMCDYLSTDDPEYQGVSKLFCRGAKRKDFVLKIEAVEKVTNPITRQKFETNEMKYKREYGKVEILHLFHGTKKTIIPSILKENLKVCWSGQSKGSLFGKGVCFSSLSHIASHYCDEKEEVKQMLLCSVLVSNIIEVPMMTDNFTLNEPPYILGKEPLRYDTTARNKIHKDVIVKYEDDTFCPVFVIHYRKQSLPFKKRNLLIPDPPEKLFYPDFRHF